MSDRIFVINGGVVQQVGSPEAIYKRPESRFVADFVGKVDFLPAVAENGAITLSKSGQKIPYDGPIRGAVTLALRPENVKIGASPERVFLKGKMGAMFYLGDVFDCRADVGGDVVRVIDDPIALAAFKQGDDVYLNIRDFLVFEGDGAEELKILT